MHETLPSTLQRFIEGCAATDKIQLCTKIRDKKGLYMAFLDT